MPKFTRLEVWSDFLAASGVRQSVFTRVVGLVETLEVMGTDQLVANVVDNDPALVSLGPRELLRVVYDDAGTERFREWRLATREYRRTREKRVVTLVADPPLMELANETIFFQESDSPNRLNDFQLIGADASEHLAQILNTANDTAAFTWTAGTIDKNLELDVVYSWDTPLSALRKLAQAAGLEINIRRNASTGYFVDLLLAVGSAEAQVELRTSANLPELNRRELPEEQATIVIPRGQQIAGQHGRAAVAQWDIIGTPTSTTVDLAGQFTGDLTGQLYAVIAVDPITGKPVAKEISGPIGFDDQYVGAAEGGAGPSMFLMFIHEVTGVRTWIGPITATTVTNQRVTVASTGTLTTSGNSRVMIVPGNTDGREGLYEIINTGKSPATDGVGTYGAIRKILDLPHIPGFQNYVQFSSLSRFVAGNSATGILLGGATIANNLDQTFIRHGTASLKVTCTNDGDGFTTPFIPIHPTGIHSGLDENIIENLFSGYWIFWNDNAGTGRVRVQFNLGTLVAGLVDEFYTFPIGTNDDTKAFSTKTQQWVSLGVAGMDRNKTLFTDQTALVDVVQMQIIQDGATAVTMFLDAVMLTRSVVQVPYVETNGGNMIVMEANKYLGAHATPDIEYSLRALDLERIDRTVWPGYEFALGQTARVVDVPAGISDTVRLVSIGRDWLKAGRTSLQLNTQPRTLASSVARFFNPQNERIVETDDSSQSAPNQAGGTGASGASSGSSYALDGWELGAATVAQNIAKATATIIERHTDDAALTPHPTNVTALAVRVPSNAALTVGTITISVVKGANAGATADATVDTVLEVALSSANIAAAAADGGVVVTALPAAFQVPEGHDLIVAYSTTVTITGSNLKLRASLEVSRVATVPTSLEGPGPSFRVEENKAQLVTGAGTARDESDTPPHIGQNQEALIAFVVWIKRTGEDSVDQHGFIFAERIGTFRLEYNKLTSLGGPNIQLIQQSQTGNDAIYNLDMLTNQGLDQWIGIAVSWDRALVANKPTIKVIDPLVSVDSFVAAAATEFQALTVDYKGSGFDGWAIGSGNSASQNFIGNISNLQVWSGATLPTESEMLTALLANAALASPAPDAHYDFISDLRSTVGAPFHDVHLAVSVQGVTYDTIGPPYQ